MTAGGRAGFDGCRSRSSRSIRASSNLGFRLEFLPLLIAGLGGASVVARFRRPALALHLGRHGSLLRFWLAVDPLRLKAAVVDALGSARPFKRPVLAERPLFAPLFQQLRAVPVADLRPETLRRTSEAAKPILW
jgi:hypothetical protein